MQWRMCGCRVGLPVLCAVVTASTALGDPSPQDVRPLDLRAGVEIVNVDVVVLDGDGRPVEGLTREDFLVREDGTPQKIVNFEAVVLPEATGAAEAAQESEVQPAAPSAPPPVPATTGSGRLIAIIFDDVHLTHASAIRAREIIARFLETGVAEGDHVLLTATGSPAAWSARVPEGLGDLRLVLSRLEGRRPSRHAMGMTDYEAMRIALHGDQGMLSQVFVRLCVQGLIGNMERCEEDVKKLNRNQRLDGNYSADPYAAGGSAGRTAIMAEAYAAHDAARARRIATLSHVSRVISAAGLARGRKLVFVVSEGFLDDPGEAEWRALLEAARRARAVLHFVDARGDTAADATSTAEVSQPVHQVLANDFLDRLPLDSRGAETLAVATGGSALRNTAAAAEKMAGIVERSRAYYLLGFEPPAEARNGKYRKLAIEVRRPGVKVIARPGYYAPVDEGSKKPQTARRLLRAIDSPIDSRDLPLRLATFVLGPAGDGVVSLLVAAEVDGAALAPQLEGRQAPQHLECALVARPREAGRPIAAQWPLDLDLPKDALADFGARGLPVYRNVALRPGTYQLRVAIDYADRVGSATTTVAVPTLDSFRISTPILSDSARPAAKGRPPQPIPIAHRVFPAGTTLLCLYGVYGAKLDPASGAPRVAASLTVGPVGGEPLIRRAALDLPVGADGSFAETVPLVLRGAAPGQYEITIQVEDRVAGTVIERRQPFTIGPAPGVTDADSNSGHWTSGKKD